MVTLDTSVELRRRFITTPCLKEPPHGLIMTTLRAFNLRGRQCVELVLLVAHDLDGGHRNQFLFCRLSDGLARFVAVAAVIAKIGDGYVVFSLDLLQP